MSEKIAVHTPTKESYDILMKAYEKKGWKWNSGVKPSNYCWYPTRYIMFNDNFICVQKEYWYTIITVEEALARLWQYERGQEVLVSCNEIDREKRIYVATIEGANIPYVTVANWNEEIFNDWVSFNCAYWCYIKPLEEPIKEMTMQEVETALGHKVKIVK